MLASLVPHHELITFGTLLKPKPLESHEYQKNLSFNIDIFEKKH